MEHSGQQPHTVEHIETVEISFHNIDYIVSLSTINGDALCVEVEQIHDASRWRGDFSAKYVQDITAKTGNYKKYAVFVRMLLTAIRQESDSVFVDLLTYADLELLKSKRGPNQAPLNRTLPPNNKRYLILTYAAEFDRVHYPLPLLFQEPDPQHLQGVIRRLREEITRLSEAAALHDAKDPDLTQDLQRLREENKALRRAAAQSESDPRDSLEADRLAVSAREAQRELRLVRKERDVLAARAEAAEAELERERGLHRRELRRRAKEAADALEEAARAREQVRELRLRCRELAQQAEGVQHRSRAAVPPPEPTRARSSGPRAPTRPVRSASAFSSPTASRSFDRDPWPAPRSRTYSRATSAGTRSAEPMRPSSATSPRGRFDPTQYVRERQERIRQASAQRSRQPTPPPSRPPSRPSSGRSTPQRSRPVSRTSSGPIPPAAAPRVSSSPRPLSRRDPAAKVSAARRSPSRMLWSDSECENGPRSAPARRSSPGQPLRDRQVTDTNQVNTSNEVLPSTKPDVMGDASAEIADIDSRLHALQNFLRAAKAGVQQA